MALGGDRTHDAPLFRRPLYPSELPGRFAELVAHRSRQPTGGGFSLAVHMATKKPAASQAAG